MASRIWMELTTQTSFGRLGFSFLLYFNVIIMNMGLHYARDKKRKPLFPVFAYLFILFGKMERGK